MKMKLNENETITEFTKRYKKLLIQHHPDHGGTNKGFIELQESFKNIISTMKYKKTEYKNNEKIEVETLLTPGTLDALYRLLATLYAKDLNIEVIGSWIWVTGATKASKDWFKENKFRFAANKKAWYFTEKLTKKRYRNKNSMNDLRNMWGRYKVDSSKETKKLQPTQLAKFKKAGATF